MFLMIDNYDSFVYNLARYFQELGEEIVVVRNDKITIEEIFHLNPQGIIISPGPKTPKEAGISREIIDKFKGITPILGVCLGFQCIGEYFGAKVKKGKYPIHGKLSETTHNNEGIFKGIKSPFNVTRYHSLIVDQVDLPEELYITAKSDDGVIMGLQHRSYEIYGVQFHPEAALTEEGHSLLKNFIDICKKDSESEEIEIIIEEFKSSCNPCEVYAVFSEEKNTIFLDSSKEDKELSRFSFIGVNPYKIYKTKGNEIYIDNKVYYGDPFLELEKLIKSMVLVDKHDNIEIPFLGGCIGYFSYDIGRTIEVIEDTSEKDFDSYDSYFVFYDNIIIFDLINDKKYITALGKLQHRKKSIEDIKNKIHSAKVINEDFKDGLRNTFYSNFTKDTYIDAIKKVKNYITNGDVYITNLTQRFWCHNSLESFELYKNLRSINKAPFASYLNLEDIQVISSSPERFIKIENNKLETRPIKGTRPRGASKEEDEKNRLELIDSEKDKAELLMVTDLERNDLSKVCAVNTVKVQELFKLEEYSTVFHLVSTITGELKDNISAVKAMRECFPGGSITGTPKIRSMEIIEEMEKVRRNLYTGSIGYFDLRGNCDFNIVIRTIIKKDDKAYFGVGGGITIESDEDMEYEETLDKAKALMRVLYKCK